MPDLRLADLKRHVKEDDGVLPNGRADRVMARAWPEFLRGLSDAAWPVTVNGDRVDVRAWTVEDLPAGNALILKVAVTSEVGINVFPGWGLDSIWFDFDIRQMREQKHADALDAFVCLLATSTEREVRLSYEGSDDIVFARFSPRDSSWRWQATT